MYFLYSEEQLKEKNKILSKLSKEFKPGIVVVNGKREPYTQLSDKPSIQRFVDCKIVAEGDPKKITYTEPKVEVKRR